MARVEHGDMYSTPPDGILGRAARLLNRETFAIGNNIPVSLKGTNALVVTDANSLREDYSHYPIKNGAFFNRNQRLAMYRQAEGENGDSKVNHYAESALAQYSKLNEGGAITEPHLSDFGYLNTQFGKRLALSTSLLCSPANPLFITVDAEHDWDTHSNQRVNSTEEEDSFGWNINDISRNLLALKKDLEARKKWNTTSVFVISEFGRTIKENGARGSDHGWGGAILLMGGRIRSHADVNFKGLRSWQLPRHTNSSTAIDVKHDYRVILAEVLQKNCGFSQNKIASIFLNQVSTKDYISVCT
jgi:hypothetical protein